MQLLVVAKASRERAPHRRTPAGPASVCRTARSRANPRRGRPGLTGTLQVTAKASPLLRPKLNVTHGIRFMILVL